MNQRPEPDQPALLVDESWSLSTPDQQERLAAHLQAMDVEMRRASRDRLARRHLQEQQESGRRALEEWFERHPEQTWTFTTADGTLIRQAIVTHSVADLVAPGEKVDPFAMRGTPPAPTAPSPSTTSRTEREL